MFTQCTECETWFAISADQLRQGHGAVRCGSCFASFDALVHLHQSLPGDVQAPAPRPDDSVLASTPLQADPSMHAPVDGEPTAGAEPEARGDGAGPRAQSWSVASLPAHPLRHEEEVPVDAERIDRGADTGAHTDAADEASRSAPDSGSLAASAPDSEDGWYSPAVPSGSAEPVASDAEVGAMDEGPATTSPEHLRASQPEPEAAVPEPVDPAANDADALDPDATDSLAEQPPPEVDAPSSHTDAAHQALPVRSDHRLPEVLAADLARMHQARRNRKRRALYAVLALVGVIALVLQYAWWMPNDLVKRYPLARGWVEHLCEHTGCELAVLRKPDAIGLVSRDVRIHPKYEGALQITAALVNRAGYAQPYPTIDFTIYNVNGQTIATRAFAPQTYLGPTSPTESSALMPASQPVQVVLELLAPEEAAVSFEFRFR